MYHPYLSTKCSAYTKANTKCNSRALDNGFCYRHRDRTIYSTAQQTFSICFSDKVAANNEMEVVGQEQLVGQEQQGFTLDDLNIFKSYFNKNNIKSEIYDLSFKSNAEAYILIAKKGLECFASSIDLLYELDKQDKDTKVFFHGRVVNSTTKHNLLFDNDEQEPDYENKKGRVVSFNSVPILNHVKNSLNILDKNLRAHVNYYYDINKCKVGFQGSEGKIHIGVRLGSPMLLRFGWFYLSKQVGANIDFNLQDGDIYILSEKATGHDYKVKHKLTLRHCDVKQ